MKKLIILLIGVIAIQLGTLNSAYADSDYYNTYTNYTVVDGDTLNSIANKYKLGVNDILASNQKLTPSSSLVEGQQLVIPNLSNIKKMQDEVIRLTNIERVNNGLTPFTSSWKISMVARYKADDMRENNYFSHYSPTLGDAFLMLRSYNIPFDTAGENIAARQTTPEQVVQSWMNSPTHRENILNSKFTKMGVGYSNGGILTDYWVQMFTN